MNTIIHIEKTFTSEVIRLINGDTKEVFEIEMPSLIKMCSKNIVTNAVLTSDGKMSIYKEYQIPTTVHDGKRKTIHNKNRLIPIAVYNNGFVCSNSDGHIQTVNADDLASGSFKVIGITTKHRNTNSTWLNRLPKWQLQENDNANKIKQINDLNFVIQNGSYTVTSNNDIIIFNLDEVYSINVEKINLIRARYSSTNTQLKNINSLICKKGPNKLEVKFNESNLSVLNIGNGLYSLRLGMFAFCKLVNVDLRRVNTLRKIGNYGFKGNGLLESIRFPENIKEYGHFTLAHCPKLRLIELSGNYGLFWEIINIYKYEGTYVNTLELTTKKFIEPLREYDMQKVQREILENKVVLNKVALYNYKLTIKLRQMHKDFGMQLKKVFGPLVEIEIIKD